MRLKTPIALLCALLAIADLAARQDSSPGNLPPQGAIFVVRHAERADAGTASTADPGLSGTGRERAVSLASLLKDAGITAIFVTEFRRTQETATPLANSLGIVPAIVESKDSRDLITRLRRTAGNALVVGHSNTLPEILKQLGLPAPTINDTDYDNLFIVLPGPSSSDAAARLIRLHYR